MNKLLPPILLVLFFLLMHPGFAQGPVADFSASATTVYSGSHITFTDLSTGSPTQWLWDFGAEAFPRTSTAQHPQVAWATPGTYDVTLTVTNASGTNSKTISGYVTVLEYSTPAVNPAEIGTGTTPGRYPLSSGDYPRSAALYTAAELGSAGVIEALAWYAQLAEESRPVEIYLKHTTATTLSGTETWYEPSGVLAGATLVYQSGLANNAGEWINLTLQTPFEYDGTSNLMVIVFSNAKNKNTTGAGISATATPNIMHLYWTPSGNGLATNTEPLRPNLRIRFREYASPVANFMKEFRSWSFEEALFPPQGWTIVNTDGRGAAWDLSTEHNNTVGGSRSAVHAGGKNNNEKGYLISPQLSLPAGDAVLTFFSKIINASAYGGTNKITVLISTTGTNPADFTPLWSPATVNSNWTKTTIDLKAYNGQAIYLAFLYEGNTAHSWHLDDVTITALQHNIVTVVQGQPAVIQDYSSGGPILWEWTTPGATPAVQYNQHATVSYAEPGMYDVTLRVGNPGGTNTKTVAGFVYVLPEGQTVTHTEWTGGVDTQWGNAGNWTQGVPAGQDVIINAATNQPLLDAGTVVGNLTLNAGACLTIGSQGKLTVTGTLSNLAGPSGLVLESDASLIHSTPGVEATVKRTVSGGWETWDAGWHLISSPVNAQPLAALTTSGAAGDGYDLYGWDEPTATWKNYKATGFSSWNGGTEMITGRGYLVSYEMAASEKSFAGILNVSDHAVSNLSFSGNLHSGWHLLGNPFTADLQWNDASWKMTGVAATAKIWKEAAMSYIDIAPNGVIPLAQGFMIQVISGTNSLTIPAASRLHSNQAWYKNHDLHRIKLVARENDNRSFQENQIVISPATSTAFDPQHDSRFLAGYAPQFYSMKAGEMLSTHAMPFVYDGMVIPMGFIKNEASHYEIELEEELYGTDLYLHDKKLGVQHLLTLGAPYAFTSEGEDDPLRFELHFGQEKAAGILAASPLALQVYARGNQLHVNFTEEGTGRSLEVFDLNGRRLVARDLDKGLRHVHALDLPGGIYLVRVVMQGQVMTQKVVVGSW